MYRCAVPQPQVDRLTCVDTSTRWHSQAPEEPTRAPFATQSATHLILQMNHQMWWPIFGSMTQLYAFTVSVRGLRPQTVYGRHAAPQARFRAALPDRITVSNGGRPGERAPTRRYGRQADLRPDFFRGGRTERSARFASSADVRLWLPSVSRGVIPGPNSVRRSSPLSSRVRLTAAAVRH